MDVLKLILENKFAVLHNIAQVYMLWWVSSTAFCGAIIAAAWTKRNELAELQHLNQLITAIYLFFSTITFFGFFGVGSTYFLLAETRAILQALNLTGGTFSEFHITAVGILIGTTSFILYMFIWRRLANRLRQLKAQFKLKKQNKKNVQEG